MNALFAPLSRAGAVRLSLVGTVFLGLLIVLLVSETGAQDTPPDVNGVAAETEPAAPAADPVSFGEPPEGFVWSVNGELVALEEVGVGREPAAGNATSAGGSGANYYLTQANYSSDKALTACAAGYRMASLWEIVDPSNLTYAHGQPDAFTRSDSGEGPPGDWYGRVQTGAHASTVDSAGTGNCAAWTSVSGDHNGTFVRLANAWETPPGEIGGIWDANAFACSFVGPVWCIQD